MEGVETLLSVASMESLCPFFSLGLMSMKYTTDTEFFSIFQMFECCHSFCPL